MTTHTKIIVLIIIVVVAILALWLTHTPSQVSSQPITTVLYSCNGGKTITATYYQGVTKPAPGPGQPPIPSGSVALTFSDGSTMTLAQTISADGVRYANTDESFVFWSKGNGVLVLENNQEKNYIGCVAVAPNPAGQDLPQIYSNSTYGFSIRLPADYTVDESYQYQELGPDKDISGIKFTIPASVATGTNLSPGSYISVEEISKTNPPAGGCAATLFLDPQNIATSTLTDGDVTYLVASSTGAAAGNRYEETVYALPGTNPCIAMRYFIHYGVIENYPAGMVQEFNQPELLATFDAIRRTLIITQ
ncbi:MAG: MliC family protein [Minisyncoccia bacterium]|jgi:membrane-bound inhibitor of C-type lysozyme